MQMHTPDTKILHYYSEGVPRGKEVSAEDMRAIITDINNTKLTMYFPQYWNHSDVRRFKALSDNDLDIESVVAVSRKLAELLLVRDSDCVHWLERVNVFHLFGLIRIYGDALNSRSLEFLTSIYSRAHAKSSVSFLLVSAINAMSVLEHRDIGDENRFFNLVRTNPSIVRDFGNYQIHYHGGIHECIQELYCDLNKRNKMPIPSSVLSLLVSCDLHYKDDPAVRQRLYDQLYSPLPTQIKDAIDRNYKFVREHLIETYHAL